MDSIYFAVVCLAVVAVIFWSAQSDELPPEKQTGPFALRRGRVGGTETRGSPGAA